MAMDVDGDGKDELITGGRTDLGERMVADLQIWKLQTHGITLITGYKWTSDASTRIRDIRLIGADGYLSAGFIMEAEKKSLGFLMMQRTQNCDQ